MCMQGERPGAMNRNMAPLGSVIPATTEPCSGMGRHFSTSKLTGFFD